MTITTRSPLAGSGSPLSLLSDEIIRLSETCVSTPVLVTPTYLSLRDEFLVELVGTLAKKSARRIRIDWFRGGSGVASLIGDLWAARRARSINRQLSSRADQDRSYSFASYRPVQVTATIGRTASAADDLVVGICQQRYSLPSWTTSIFLGSSPDRVEEPKLAL